MDNKKKYVVVPAPRLVHCITSVGELKAELNWTIPAVWIKVQIYSTW